MEPIPGVILAGGRSSRMGGGEKALADLAGAPLIAHVIGRLAPQTGALAINSNADPALYDGIPLPLLRDSIPGRPGPLAGILAALDWAGPLRADHVLTVAADMPFLPHDLVAQLRQMARPEAIVAARSPAGMQPVCALWPVPLAATLRDWLTRHQSAKVRDFVGCQPHVWCDFPPPAPGAPDPFFNANTPQDLARAAEIVSADGPRKVTPAGGQA